MHRLLVSGATLALVSASACFAGGVSTETAPSRLRDPVVGWSVGVPAGWRIGGRVAATAFSVGARCRSALAVDRVGDEGIGPGPGVSRSFVQVCARVRTDGRTLSGYLAATYGDAFAAQFEPTRLGGHPAYRSRRSSPELVWLQTGHHRIQLAAAITSDPEHRGRRRAEVERIRRSFRLD